MKYVIMCVLMKLLMCVCNNEILMKLINDNDINDIN